MPGLAAGPQQQQPGLQPRTNAAINGKNRHPDGLGWALQQLQEPSLLLPHGSRHHEEEEEGRQGETLARCKEKAK